MKICTYQNILTVKVLDAAPVLCPPPDEPTLSRACLPQSETDEKMCQILSLYDVCFIKTDTHLLIYTLANVSPF